MLQGFDWFVVDHHVYFVDFTDFLLNDHVLDVFDGFYGGLGVGEDGVLGHECLRLLFWGFRAEVGLSLLDSLENLQNFGIFLFFRDHHHFALG